MINYQNNIFNTKKDREKSLFFDKIKKIYLKLRKKAVRRQKEGFC